MENPHMQEQVLEVLDKLRPFLLRDGGDVELVDIEEGIVKLRLMGACGRSTRRYRSRTSILIKSGSGSFKATC